MREEEAQQYAGILTPSDDDLGRSGQPEVQDEDDELVFGRREPASELDLLRKKVDLLRAKQRLLSARKEWVHDFSDDFNYHGFSDVEHEHGHVPDVVYEGVGPTYVYKEDPHCLSGINPLLAFATLAGAAAAYATIIARITRGGKRKRKRKKKRVIKRELKGDLVLTGRRLFTH